MSNLEGTMALAVGLLACLYLATARETRGAAGGLGARNLRCEYRAGPLGIDVVSPRLSWVVESTDRGQTQTAYQILVASTRANLDADRGDLWDSGRVRSDETAHVAYGGRPLGSRTRCHWKVRVWGSAGRASAWGEPGLWTMGLLEGSDWRAAWIGCDDYQKAAEGTEAEVSFAGAKWIWSAGGGGDPRKNAPAGTRYFRGAFSLPRNAEIKRARIRVTADDQFTLYVNGKRAGKSDRGTDAWRRPKTVDVTKLVSPGRNVVGIEAVNSAASPAGLLAKLVVTPAEGKPVTLVTDGSWKCADRTRGEWQRPASGDRPWPAARALGNYGCAPWGRIGPGKGGGELPPPRYLRKEFALGKPVRRATLYATALGICELRLNGRKVGEDFFTPGWTDYNKRVYYNTYDVTGLLRRGGNALGAIVADGWYAGYIGYRRQRKHYGEKLRLRAQLEVEYTDGTKQVIATDRTWKAATGPELEADFLMGETCDARKEMPGWDAAGFDDAEWGEVNVTTNVKGKVEAAPHQPVRVFKELNPVKITEPRPGAYVLDLGTNFAGFVRLKVTARRGKKITLRFAERLNPDGTIYTKNLRTARTTDTYYCRGGGRETWQPRFTFHGFQYVEATGLPGKPRPDTITGIELTSATPVVGSFECSDKAANQLYHNICQTQRSNFIDIPTDCPQRDERLGWTGDAEAYIRTATYNTDVAAFFTKWLVDLSDAQRGDGQYPMVAPLKVAGGDGGPAWADAGTICPLTVYEVYGDKQVLKKHYDGMAKFIAFCKRRSPGLLPPRKFHCFGDWLSIRANTPKDVIYAAYFAQSTKLMARAAEALGRTDDAERYNGLFADIREVFNKAYVGADGRIKGNTQTVYVMALAFDLVEGEKRRAAVAHLVDEIRKRQWHLSTGFVGTKDLMTTLTKIGRTDVAYRLFHNDTFPSWGFSIKHGATSIWERWDGWRPDKGFQTPGMNSFAHYAYGAVGEWMFKTVGGIDTDGPGFKRILVRPLPGGKLTWAKVSYDSIRGRIATDWKLTGRGMTLNVTIPANTTATVYVPAKDAGSLTEGGRPVGKAEGVKFLRMEEGAAVYEVASGSYAFVSRGAKGIGMAR